MRLLDIAGSGDRKNCKTCHYNDQHAHIAREKSTRFRAGQLHTGCPAKVSRVHYQCFENKHKGNGRDRKKDATQSDGQQTDQKTNKTGDQARDSDLQKDRCCEGQMHHQRCIGACANECRHTEVHVSGVAAQNIPSACQYDRLQDNKAREKQIIVSARQS